MANLIRTLLSNRARALADQYERNNDDLSDIVEGGVPAGMAWREVFVLVLDTLESKSMGAI
jgi:hypothetical protein